MQTVFAENEVGFSIPAVPGMREEDVQTPALLLDMDALKENIRRMGDYCQEAGIRHRLHGKMHKSVDVALLQMNLGGACGVCCQKVSEAEVFARGGVLDILITNQVRDPRKIERLARLPLLGARTIVCVDALENVGELSRAASKHGTTLECLVELDCGAGRCGVLSPGEALEIASAVASAPGLLFSGLQAYHGSAQHLETYSERSRALSAAIDLVREVVQFLANNGFECEIVGGGGTGTFEIESASGVYNELQCGSYAFMDADYGRIRDRLGRRLDKGQWKNSLFLLTSVMSHTKPDIAVCDAGLKSQSVDSGLPLIFDREELQFLACNDEHGLIADPQGTLQINDKLRLVPGHCDPTCNLHDWYVCVQDGRVEALWPVSARGKAY